MKRLAIVAQSMEQTKDNGIIRTVTTLPAETLHTLPMAKANVVQLTKMSRIYLKSFSAPSHKYVMTLIVAVVVCWGCWLVKASCLDSAALFISSVYTSLFYPTPAWLTTGVDEGSSCGKRRNLIREACDRMLVTRQPHFSNHARAYELSGTYFQPQPQVTNRFSVGELP